MHNDRTPLVASAESEGSQCNKAKGRLFLRFEKILHASVDRLAGVTEIEYFGLHAGCYCWHGVSFPG